MSVLYLNEKVTGLCTILSFCSLLSLHIPVFKGKQKKKREEKKSLSNADGQLMLTFAYG
jgi:hypothetical protein